MEISGDVSKARFIAAFIDNLLALALMLIAVSIVPESLTTLRAILLVSGYLGYFLVTEGAFGRTLGKYWQGLIVRQLDGRRGDWNVALKRTLARVVEVNPALFGALPAGLILLSSERKQRLGDMWADALVVSDKLHWEADTLQ